MFGRTKILPCLRQIVLSNRLLYIEFKVSVTYKGQSVSSNHDTQTKQYQ